MGKEREKERYLCVLCWETLYCVDLGRSSNNNNNINNNKINNNNINNDDGDDDHISKRGEANVIFSVNLKENDLPLFGMRSLEYPISSGNIYLIGGECHPQPDPSAPWRVRPKLSEDIFKVIPPRLPPDYYYDHNNPPASKKMKLDDADDIEFRGGGGGGVTLKKMNKTKDHDDLSLSLPALNAGKGSPIIECIGGKIYALHTGHRMHPIQVPSPAFEVLDKDDESGQMIWKPLSDPPFYDCDQNQLELGLGRKAIIICTVVFADRWLHVIATCPPGPWIFAVYDTVNDKWSSSDESYFSDFNSRYLPKPFYITTTSRGRDNYYVQVSVYPEQPAVAYLTNSKGAQICQQTLRDLLEPADSPPYSGPFLIPLEGENRMCAFRSTKSAMYFDSTCLDVTIFSLTACPPDQVLPIIDRLSADMDMDMDMDKDEDEKSGDYPPPKKEVEFVSLNIERRHSLIIRGSLNDSDLHLAEHAFFI